MRYLSKNQFQQNLPKKNTRKKIYSTNNLIYGDTLQTIIGSLTRILGHNVNGIESSNFVTLEVHWGRGSPIFMSYGRPNVSYGNFLLPYDVIW